MGIYQLVPRDNWTQSFYPNPVIRPYKYEKTEKQGEVQCQSTEEERLEKRKKIFSKDTSIE